ncbi:adenylate/guanylate cyclase domain-containing protein [Sinorhizobium sp. 8-89]|uniref:adenylate/guanylate cyclase domain-containing protein n=1 Tax=Sinorhizobium sp. 7-81 TaxID=3049087 RepID=UPI0024C28D39|nr:adenylate/guanylate cyclase domain-containing protein [Sinorhizobium sp. 7-81]MDK1387911.1 adenylate/guanylate cyclase domain-containing protein [Sinorhizobium sp. 7-81]
MERKLAAVMMADVSGYGLLSQADEEGARVRFRADLSDIFEQRIAEHCGRLIKTMGDGLLVEFPSVVEAVRCAVEVQRAKSKNRDRDKHQLEFRIGINLGDVIVEGDDIHGDGVIIAERLQSLAEPGGIVISGTAYDHVEKHLDVAFISLGEKRLKHVYKPIRTYRIVLDGVGSRRKVKKSRGRRLFAIAGCLLLLAAASIGMWWWRPWDRPVETLLTPQQDLPLPDKPSIAVLPFANVSDDPKQEYFADGMTDGLVTELAQISELFVIARNSTFSYKGKAVSPRQVSKDLGVRYILEGSVQRAGDQLRINAKLIDSLNGGHVWAGKFDGTLSDVFALQDKVTSGIADALAVRLTSASETRKLGYQTPVSAAFDAFLRGWEHHRRSTPEDLVKAIPFFERAIELDPGYGRAYAAAAMVYARIYLWHWNSQLPISRSEAKAKAVEYLESARKSKTALGHQAASLLSEADWQHPAAVAELKEAIALEPGDSWSYALMAFVLTSSGRPEEAIPHIRTAMRLDPKPPSFFMYVLGLTEFSMENFQAAATAARTSTELNPEDDSSLLLLAAAYGHLGLKRDAAAAIARFNKLSVEHGGIAATISTCPSLDFALPDDRERLHRGLRFAGVPENPTGIDSGKELEPAEIRSLLFGQRLRGRVLGSGEAHEMIISPGGRATLSGGWTSLGIGNPSDVEVRIDGNEVCFSQKETALCGVVLRNPGGLAASENEFVWYYGDRALTFSPLDFP